MTWSHSGDLFLLTNGAGRVKILSWPSLDLLHTLDAHTSNCFSLEFDPRGRYGIPLHLLQTLINSIGSLQLEGLTLLCLCGT
jgi:WD40 repeat protein